MVDDEIDRGERIDLLGIAFQHRHCIAHGGQIHHRRNPGEILHQYARRPVCDFAVRSAGLQPVGDRTDILDRDRAAIFMPQQVFEQNLQRIGQPRNAGKPILLRRFEAEIGISLVADGEFPPSFETVEAGHCTPVLSVW